MPTIDCNMLIQDGDRICCVKDTCEGCKTNPKECALYDLYENAGLIKIWDKWDIPTFRERQKRKEQK